MTSSPDLNRVTLEVPARTDHLHLLRLNAAVIAGSAFAIDDVEDVKIAVEELAAALVGIDDAEPVLHVDIVLADDSLRVSGRRRMNEPQPIALDEFVPTILDALVDDYSYATIGDEACFHFEKQIRDR